MKLRCQRGELLAAIQKAALAVPSRDLKPVLSNVKFTAERDKCNVSATDMEIGLRLDLSGSVVAEPGEALLPAKRLQDILRESPDDELAIESADNTGRVLASTSEFELPTEDPAHFPDVPCFSDDQHHEVRADTIRDMIRRTIFAAATEHVRYAIAGTLWEIEGKTMRLVATDGHRLAVAHGESLPSKGQDTNGQPHVIPTKAMQLLERNLSDPDEVVRICIRTNDCLFKAGRATIYSRLVEGRYPPYREIIPKKSTTKTRLVVGSFLAAVRQAAVMTDNEIRRVVFSFAPNTLTLEARGTDIGRSKVELPMEHTGKAMEIAFDPGLLIDMLRALNADAELTLEMTDSKSPALFRSGNNYSYVLMPLS